MKPKIPICLLLFLLSLSTTKLMAQDKVTLSGEITDAEDGEGLIGATVKIEELSTGTTTNAYGYYSISVEPGEYTVVFSYIGYVTETKKINLTENIKLNIELGSDDLQLGEVEVSDVRGDENISEVEMSTVKLDIKTIQKVPPLLGEVDVVRSIQLLPGVSTVGEGATGFNVRGGGIDQNLVLLDDAPVYNSSHLFGFFSVFNPDAVKDVKLIKGGIPAQYGGRLSSILDVKLKEGNSKKFSGRGGAGLIFSRLMLEGPITEKGAFLIAGRRSYIDILSRPFLDDDLSDARFFFYDLTLKANYKFSDKDRLFISGYFGRDVFGTAFTFNWGSATATVRWNHLFNDKLFLNTTAFYSNYDYRLGVEQESDGFRWDSRILNYSLKPEFTYYPNSNNTIKFGGQAIYYDFDPGTAIVTSNNQEQNISLSDQYAIENAIFISNKQTVSPLLSLEYGLRLSGYTYLGPSRVFNLADTVPGERRRVESREDPDDWENVKTYWNLEPRVSAKYQLDEKSSVKASYNRTAQYIHLISNTTAASPLDIWTPSTNNIEPQLANQLALGYFRNFGERNDYETSIEVFYKNFENQIDYIDGADLLLNERLEADLLSGIARAYGMELYIKRNKGKLNGWISYTLSRSERQVTAINRGEWYPNQFDRTHNLNTVVIYNLSDKWSFSGNFVLQSGIPATYPTNRYQIQGFITPHNIDESRNNFRLPAYHRLDLSATLQGKQREKFESEWVFSLYNVYARRNPFSIFFQQDPNDFQNTQAVQFSLLGTIVPSVAYNFKF